MSPKTISTTTSEVLRSWWQGNLIPANWQKSRASSRQLRYFCFAAYSRNTNWSPGALRLCVNKLTFCFPQHLRRTEARVQKEGVVHLCHLFNHSLKTSFFFHPNPSPVSGVCALSLSSQGSLPCITPKCICSRSVDCNSDPWMFFNWCSHCPG